MEISIFLTVTPSEITTSSGQITLSLYFCNISFAYTIQSFFSRFFSSTKTSSIKELPRSLPCAFKKTFATAPPINTLSAISDKVDAVNNLLKMADKVLIGGAVANVFLKAQGRDLGSSFIEDVFVDEKKREKKDWIVYAKEILQKYKDKVICPED